MLTSRVPQGLYAEYMFRVSPFSVRGLILSYSPYLRSPKAPFPLTIKQFSKKFQQKSFFGGGGNYLFFIYWSNGTRKGVVNVLVSQVVLLGTLYIYFALVPKTILGLTQLYFCYSKL